MTFNLFVSMEYLKKKTKLTHTKVRNCCISMAINKYTLWAMLINCCTWNMRIWSPFSKETKKLIHFLMKQTNSINQYKNWLLHQRCNKIRLTIRLNCLISLIRMTVIFRHLSNNKDTHRISKCNIIDRICLNLFFPLSYSPVLSW